MHRLLAKRIKSDGFRRTRGKQQWPGQGRPSEMGMLCQRTTKGRQHRSLVRLYNLTYSLLDIGMDLASRKVTNELSRGEALRDGEDLGAVYHLRGVLVDHSERLEDELEAILELSLIRCKRLPLARRARVTSDQVIGLKAHLALEGRLHGALDAGLAGEEYATELGVDEELTVEQSGCRVEGCARDGRVDIVSSAGGVGDESPDSLERVEFKGIVHAVEDLVNQVEWFGDETIGGGPRGLNTMSTVLTVSDKHKTHPRLTNRATNREADRGCARAVGHCEGARKVDEIARGHVVLLLKRLFNVDDLIEADVGVVSRLNVSEGHDRAVGTVPATFGVSGEKNT